jgi:hypothetical protein
MPLILWLDAPGYGASRLPANFSKSPPIEKYSMESYLLRR